VTDAGSSLSQSIATSAHSCCSVFSVMGTGSLSNNRLPEARTVETYGMRVAHALDVNYTQIRPEIGVHGDQ
jgi:hypothetical protein